MWQRLRSRLHYSFAIWITIMWCLLMGEVTWANVIAGVLIGVGIQVALPLPAMPVGGLTVRWHLLAGFLCVWLKDLFFASVKVAWLALRRSDPPKTAIVRMPMRVSNELVLYLATVFYNLQPGGAICDVDIAQRLLTVHLLDVDDASDLEREVATMATLERRLIRIFEGVDPHE